MKTATEIMMTAEFLRHKQFIDSLDKENLTLLKKVIEKKLEIIEKEDVIKKITK